MPEKKIEDVEKTTEKKSDTELSEKELEETAGGIGEQYGRQTTPKILPYIEQDN